jgi:peroxiredoxin
VTSLKDKPFALIGVNIAGSDTERLKKVMDEAELNWRSFADPGAVGQGPIASKWNLSATPTIYVIDHKGIIRHKWVGAANAKTIDAALEPLIKAAEAGGK